MFGLYYWLPSHAVDSDSPYIPGVFDLVMSRNVIAETIAEVAERERMLAVEEGEYVWAFICAVVELHAKEAMAPFVELWQFRKDAATNIPAAQNLICDYEKPFLSVIPSGVSPGVESVLSPILCWGIATQRGEIASSSHPGSHPGRDPFNPGSA